MEILLKGRGLVERLWTLDGEVELAGSGYEPAGDLTVGRVRLKDHMVPASSLAKVLAPSTSGVFEAAGVFESLARLRAAPDTGLRTHGSRGHLATRVVGAPGDEDLSMHLCRLARRSLGGTEPRRALVRRVQQAHEVAWKPR